MVTAELLGDVLGVWGHPDDEAWLSAGVMMDALRRNRRAVCVTATKGEGGFPADDARTVEERTRVRENELAASLRLMGVTEHRWLGYDDGRCRQVPDEEAIAAIGELLAEFRPDTVLTFGPDGMTGHSDHIAVCRWTTLAVEKSSRPIRLLYATRTRRWHDEFFGGVDLSTIMMVPELEPETLADDQLALSFSCDEELLPRKVAALLAQESQIKALADEWGAEFFAAALRDEVFREPWTTDPERLVVTRALSQP